MVMPPAVLISAVELAVESERVKIPVPKVELKLCSPLPRGVAPKSPTPLFNTIFPLLVELRLIVLKFTPLSLSIVPST